MARIRTIKPEFPQSESMGKVSRDARLLFVQMWTLSDDSGRLRGNSRMLASLLFPYDDDAPGLINTWMGELEREKCIVRYTGPDGSSYVAICHWNNHQKIDKPSVSKLPDPKACTSRESSRAFANDLEPSIPSRARADQGPRTKEGTKDQGEGEEADRESPALSVAKEEEFIPDESVNPFDGSAEFAAQWRQWKRHRSEKHKPLGAVEEEGQLLALSRQFGAEEAASVVAFTIQRGALNLITNGDHKGKPPLGPGGKGGYRAKVSFEEGLLR